MKRALLLALFLFSFNASASKDAKQIDCLAKAIYFEARGEDWDGMVAVAQVATNRLNSGKFPDTYCKVIHQKDQFSWTKNKPKVNDKDSWNQALAVAKVTYYVGFPKDITKGALYFHSGSQPGWAKKFKKTITVNNHKFYKERK